MVCPTEMGVTEQSGPVPDCVTGIRKPPISEFWPLGDTKINERRPIELPFAKTLRLNVRDPVLLEEGFKETQLDPPEGGSIMTP